MGDMNMHAITVEMPTLLRYVHQFQKKKKNVVCPTRTTLPDQNNQI